MVIFSSILIPDSSSTWAPLFTCTTEHFFWIPVKADILHRSSIFLQHTVQLIIIIIIIIVIIIVINNNNNNNIIIIIIIIIIISSSSSSSSIIIIQIWANNLLFNFVL